MTQHYGIDTSILVRLMTGDPTDDYTATVVALEKILLEDANTKILVSNQVIGEAYIAVRHHYGVSREQARSALLSVFQSGLIAPLHGDSVIHALGQSKGCGLLDRLIAIDYTSHHVTTLTHDRKMAALEGVMRLRVKS